MSTGGSSPPARGAARSRARHLARRRFIPAWGERLGNGVKTKDCYGSSPPARGTAVPPVPALEDRRFIPACEGNGCAVAPAPTRKTVHPRLRGERPAFACPSIPPSGSSPPARGTAPRSGARHRPTRFIPACAGNGSACASRSAAPTVHPRLRGERSAARLEGLAVNGSSPPARGTVGLSNPAGLPARFIPACAGNGRPTRASVRGWPVHPRLRGERASPVSVTVS